MATLPVTPSATSTPPTLKHWRSFGAAEWSHVKEGALGLLLGSLLPVGLFYGGFRIWGFSAAVVIVLTWSALVFAWHFRRTGGADVFSATTFGFAIVKASAGLLSISDGGPVRGDLPGLAQALMLGDAVRLHGDQWLYLAWPSLENMVYGIAFFGSALLGRPLLVLFAQRLYPIPPTVRASDAFRRAFLITSSVWLVGHSLRAILRLWLLAHLPLELYLVADTVAGWPINVTMMGFTAWYPLRALRRAGFVSVAPVAISTADVVELAVEETAPRTV